MTRQKTTKDYLFETTLVILKECRSELFANNDTDFKDCIYDAVCFLFDYKDDDAIREAALSDRKSYQDITDDNWQDGVTLEEKYYTIFRTAETKHMLRQGFYL